MSGDNFTRSRRWCDEKFPIAMVMWDSQCSDLHHYTDVIWRAYRKQKKGRSVYAYSDDRLQVLVNTGRLTGSRKLTWHPGAEVWVRYSCGVRTRPDYGSGPVTRDECP